MTKKDFKLLERVFEREIAGHLLQSGSREYERLETEGMVDFKNIVLGGRFPVTIKGWVLTHRGRIVYCQECSSNQGAKQETG